MEDCGGVEGSFHHVPVGVFVFLVMCGAYFNIVGKEMGCLKEVKVNSSFGYDF